MEIYSNNFSAVLKASAQELLMKRGLNGSTKRFHTTQNWESSPDEGGSILRAAASAVTSPVCFLSRKLCCAIVTKSH